MPSYNDTPLATNPINQTQAPIRTNFQSIMALVDVNHVDFANAVDFGKHKWVTFPQQVQATAQAALTYPDLGVYSAPYAVSGINELWFRNSGNIPTDIPFTAAEYSSTTGWTYLPSGILLKWGVCGAQGAGSSVVVTAAQGPSVPSAQILSVLITPYSASTSVTRDATFGGLNGMANQFICRSVSGIQAPGANYLMIAWATP